MKLLQVKPNRTSDYIGTLPNTTEGLAEFEKLRQTLSGVVLRRGRHNNRKQLAADLMARGVEYATCRGRVEYVHSSLRRSVPLEFATHFDIYQKPSAVPRCRLCGHVL